jgi:hypothetical protein
VSTDRLFFFSMSLAMMAVNRMVFQLMGAKDEIHPLVYVVRLLAFCLIIVAILDKNCHGRLARKSGDGR